MSAHLADANITLEMASFKSIGQLLQRTDIKEQLDGENANVTRVIQENLNQNNSYCANILL